MNFQHDLGFGAELIDGGRATRFRLWAPGSSQVQLRLVGDGAPAPLAMAPESGGWFAVTTDEARAGSRYQFLVGDLAVPDPASRFQPEDVHGPSEVVDPAAYRWRETGWRGRPWEEVVIYELHTGTFSASGRFEGVIEHLDHLVALGVTAVELLPVADFPGQRNWGYDGVLLFAPDSRYGRPEELKALVDACHARGLCIFLDVVYNHFGPDGNYLPVYAPKFFTERHKTPWGAAIDFDSDAVRAFYVHNALYWLEEFRFDGLRLDAVHAIVDENATDIVTEIAQAVRARHGESGRHIHLILENDKNQARYLGRADGGDPVLHTAQWNDDIHHALRVVTTGQRGGYYADYADRPAERLGRALAEGFVYQGDPSAYRDGEVRGEPSAHLPPTAFISFIQNHDQVGNDAFGTRLSHKADEPALKAAIATYLLAPQIPMLFMGEEWGSKQPFAFFCDFEPELAEAVRNGRREEFAKFPEFSDPAARERIPDPTAPATFQNCVLDWTAPERPEHAGRLQRYRELLALRAREIAPRLKGMGGHAGRHRALGDEALEVRWQMGDGSELILRANYGAEALSVPDAEPEGARLLHATPAPPAAGRLEPHQVAFWLKAPA